MDVLRPGHAHRSSSDRLLNNYLEAQKHLSTSLLTLLSHSHSSTSSLLAYVTSSPGVIHPVRRSVRHAAFEGPLSPSLVENWEGGSHTGSVSGGDAQTQGWAAYVSSLDQFRKDLKQIHLLEEELSRVKRDREILVTRLIKTTKSRPTKSDLSAIASTYARSEHPQSSRVSLSSVTSGGSTTSKEGKRAGKLADAQAELLGCEEHLRGLEIRIEHERNKVMLRGLEDRFRSMEVVGRMWVSQAKKGLEDLEKAHELPADAFELDSNPSIAPSQSASQMAYEDSPGRGAAFRRANGRQVSGSVAGSIAEEEEGSSDDDATNRKLVVHENRPGSAFGNGPTSPIKARNSTVPGKPSPLGVPSVNTRTRPLSSTYGEFGANGNDSDSDSPNFRSGGRRAASDVGAMGYRPPTNRQPLRRTFSDDKKSNNPTAGLSRRSDSDAGSIRSQRKKKGFFASISKFFKGPKSRREGSVRSGRDSPPYGSGSKVGAWQTRTDQNLKRSSVYGSTSRGGSRFGRRGGDDSSSDDEAGGNLVSVSNNRGQNTFSVDSIGRPGSRATKRESSGPVASGLIPAPPAMKRNSSQSTITGRATPTQNNRSGAATPVAANTKANSKPSSAVGLTRSNTAKSGMSVASGKTTTTIKSATGTATGTPKKTRANGSISRASLSARPAVDGRNIMSLVDSKSAPVMPEVPKAPSSQVTPQMSLPKAPGSSIVPPGQVSMPAISASSPNLAASATTPKARPLSRSSTAQKVSDADRSQDAGARATTPLPPSRTLSPPLKSALRPSSPSPEMTSTDRLPPPVSMFSISAPGPVSLPKEAPLPITMPAAPAKPAPAPVAETAKPATRPDPTKAAGGVRKSYTSGISDNGSVYESAVEDDDEDEDGGAPGIPGVTAPAAAAPKQVQPEHYGDSSDSEEDEGQSSYKVVDNERIKRLGINVGPPAVERIPSETRVHRDEVYAGHDDASVTSNDTATKSNRPTPAPLSIADDKLSRRKSVRMNVPDSPGPETALAPPPITDPSQTTSYVSRSAERDPSPPPTQDRSGETWSTRIGKMREDTSDESDHDDEYLRARKGLSKNSGKWEKVDGSSKSNGGESLGKKLKRKATGSSVKSKSSTKGSQRG